MKVAIYCRLSEEDNDKINPIEDSQSIQNQKSLLINYAYDRKWDVYNIYSDDDYTGADRLRPEFNRLISDAQEKKFDIILCKSQSRFTRELELVEKYIHGLFVEWNIRFVGVADNADTAIEGNKKSRQINGLVNEWYLEDMSANIKTVLRNKQQSGEHIGSFALYGYLKDPERKNHLIVDIKAAEVVKMVYNLYLEGNGSTTIANILNQKRIPNPSGYKRLNGSNFKPAKRDPKGDFWSYTTVTTILRNQMYAGDMVQHKTKKVSYKSKKEKRVPREEWIIVPNTHEAIIDRETWNNVQKLININCKPCKTGQVHVLAGKCKCASCGKILSSNHAKGIKYLRCPISDMSKDLCKGTSIQVRKLEQLVIDALVATSKDYLNNIVEENIKSPVTETSLLQKYQKEKFTLQRKIQEQETYIKNLYIDKVKGIIDENQFIDFNKHFLDESEYCKISLKEIEEKIAKIETDKEKQKTKFDILNKYTNLTELTRDVVLETIDEIKIGERSHPYSKDVPVEIVWNF